MNLFAAALNWKMSNPFIRRKNPDCGIDAAQQPACTSKERRTFHTEKPRGSCELKSQKCHCIKVKFSWKIVSTVEILVIDWCLYLRCAMKNRFYIVCTQFFSYKVSSFSIYPLHKVHVFRNKQRQWRKRRVWNSIDAWKGMNSVKCIQFDTFGWTLTHHWALVLFISALFSQDTFQWASSTTADLPSKQPFGTSHNISSPSFFVRRLQEMSKSRQLCGR